MGNLRALEIEDSLMTRMPDLSHCSKLERIILEHCFHLETPHISVGKLGYLVSLNIEYCESLRSLPEEFRAAEALQELSLIVCESIEELPESIGRLGALRVLRARNTKIRKIPASIGNLKSLAVLEFRIRPLDEDIPKETGELASLEELNLEGCDLCQLPGTIHQLSRLHSLFLSPCHELRELPEFPSGLTELRVESRSLRAFPDLSSLTNFTELVLHDFGAGLKGMSGGHSQPLQLRLLRKLHGLPVLLSTELGCLPRLQELNLYSVNISSLSQLPSSLSWLRLSYSGTAVPWVRYSNLIFLLKLHLSNSTLTEIQLGGLGWCLNLEKLLDLSCLRKLRPV